MKQEELRGIVHSDPNIMGGTPVFFGTRVPLQNLIDCLEGGESIEDFLDGFPSVKREQVLAVIEAGKLADLLVVDGDPSVRIALLQDRTNLLAIIKGGQLVKDQLGREQMP